MTALAGGQVNVEGELVTAKGLEIPGDKQRAIVGLSVCWTGTEAYYVSLSGDVVDFLFEYFMFLLLSLLFCL